MANILLIEDDPDITFAVSMGLMRARHHVDTAGTEAQGKAQYLHATPELILMDYNLPDGSGESLCAWVKAQGDIPIIFLTVRDEEAVVVHGLELGADDYITKPFSLAILLSRVHAVGDCLRCGTITRTRQRPASCRRGIWLRSRHRNTAYFWCSWKIRIRR